jgi:hypothetical protein
MTNTFMTVYCIYFKTNSKTQIETVHPYDTRRKLKKKKWKNRLEFYKKKLLICEPILFNHCQMN